MDVVCKLQIERAVQIKNLELIKQQVISDYLWKIDVVEEIYETAKGKPSSLVWFVNQTVT